MDVAVVDYAAADAPERFTESLRETGFAVPLVLAPADDVVLTGGRTTHDFMQERIRELSVND